MAKRRPLKPASRMMSLVLWVIVWVVGAVGTKVSAVGGGTVAGRCAVGGLWIACEVREPWGLREWNELHDAVDSEPFVALDRVLGAGGGVGGGDAWVEAGHGGWHKAEG